MEEIDLVDDIWLRIFQTFGVDRANLCQVSKKWRRIILSPNNWKSLENYGIFRRSFGADPQSASFINFIKHNLTNLMDVNIRGDTAVPINDFLDAFLQIKSLKRLKLEYGNPNGQSDSAKIYSSNLVPRCSDLVLLNLELSQFEMSDVGLANIVKGVPNLEELYLGPSYDMKEIYPLKKLQRVMVHKTALIDELVANLPQLKYVIIEERQRGYSFGPPIESKLEFRKIGSTIIVSPNFLSSKDANIVRQVKDLVTYDHSPYLRNLVNRVPFDREYFTFLVKEMGLDVNYVEPLMLGYRPVYLDRWASATPLAVLLERAGKTITGGSRESDAAEAYCLDVAKCLLDLGADPNRISSINPPLTLVPRESVVLLLLEHGFNIHDTGLDSVPHYVSLLNTSMPDVPRAFAEILKRENINKELLLEHAILNRRRYAIDMLNSAGVKWTSTALEQLIYSMPKLFDTLTLQSSYDTKIMTPAIVFTAIKRGLLPEVKDSLTALPDQLDSEGWTPMHHAALLHDFRGFMTGLSPSTSNPNSKFGRWTQEKKDYAFGSTTTSEIDVTRIVSPVASDKPQTTSEGLSGVGSTTSNLFGQSSNFGSSFGTEGATRIFGSGFGSGNNDGNTFGINDNKGNFNGGFGSGFGQGNNGLGFGTNSTGFGTNDSNTFGFNNNSGASTPMASQEDLERPLKCNIEEVLPLLAHCNINSRTSYGETPLLLVTKSKYLKDDEKEKNIKALLQHGADPNIPDNNGWTPLHAALYVGKWKLVAELISHGANVNAQDNIGVTPLMALLIGFVHNHSEPFTDIEEEWVKLLTLNVDVTLADKPFNRSLMHYAACVASPGMMQLICDKNPQIVNATDNEGYTPLHYAVMFGNLNAITFLLNNGANPNAQSTNHKLTPLILCASMRKESSSFRVSPILTHYLATQNLLLLASPLETRHETRLVNGSFTEPPWTKSPLKKWNEKSNNSTWSFKCLEVIELLGRVSDPHLTDAEGSSLLHHLVQLIAEPKNMDFPVLHLIASNKEFAPYWSVPNKHKTIPAKELFDQMRHGWGGVNIDLAKLVLPLIKDHQIKMFHGTDFSIVHMILNYPHELRAEFLPLIDATTLPTQVDVHVPCRIDTLLHHLVTSLCKLPTIKEALKLQPHAINVQNSIGQTPLFCAVQLLVQLESEAAQVIYLLELIDLFLAQKDIDVDKANEDGDTPLHLAAQRFHLGAIDAIYGHMQQTFIFAVPFCLTAFKLLESGARMDIKNKSGLTPLDYCPRLFEYFTEFNGLIGQHYLAAYFSHEEMKNKSEAPTTPPRSKHF